MKLMLLIYFLTAVSAFSRDLWFSSMESGDRIEITRRSAGCFHNKTSFYEVSKSGVSYTFTEYAIIWDKVAPGKIAEKKIVGTVGLASRDVEGLDELLKFYREKKEVFTNTKEDLLVEYHEGSRRIKLESLEDESAGFGLEKRPGVTRFEDLIKRFGK